MLKTSKKLSSSTKRAYDSGLKRVTTFCAMQHIHTMGGLSATQSEASLEQFAAHCGNIAPGFLYHKAVRVWCEAYICSGRGDILRDKPRLELMLRGIKKSHCTPKRVRLPITTDSTNSTVFSIHRYIVVGMCTRGVYGSPQDRRVYHRPINKSVQVGYLFCHG